MQNGSHLLTVTSYNDMDVSLRAACIRTDKTEDSESVDGFAKELKNEVSCVKRLAKIVDGYSEKLKTCRPFYRLFSFFE